MAQGEKKIQQDNKDAKYDKSKCLAEALSRIEKKCGKGAIMKMGDLKVNETLEVIPTGALSLDLALGIGGVPRGRMVELFGPESSGKTTLSLHIVAQAQKAGGIVAFIDAEHALDPNYAKVLGVNTDELLISQPDYGEQALEIAEMLMLSGAIDLIVIDSVAALVPRAELEGTMEENAVGLQARMMSKAMRKLASCCKKSNTCVIFINQIREKIGVMFGNPETTSGGRALKFAASVRLDVRRGEAIKDGNEQIGNRTKVKVVKSKVSPPFRQAEFDIIYGQGISRESIILDLAVEMDLINKAGAWFSYEGERIGQGRENAKAYLKNNTELTDALETLIRAQAQEKGLLAAPIDDTDIDIDPEFED